VDENDTVLDPGCPLSVLPFDYNSGNYLIAPSVNNTVISLLDNGSEREEEVEDYDTNPAKLETKEKESIELHKEDQKQQPGRLIGQNKQRQGPTNNGGNMESDPEAPQSVHSPHIKSVYVPADDSYGFPNSFSYEFTSHFTILTGRNGVGKTQFLRFISDNLFKEHVQTNGDKYEVLFLDCKMELRNSGQVREQTEEWKRTQGYWDASKQTLISLLFIYLLIA
jgi:ATPase subunit of ABC transporter with duplicated ATPase domains